MVGQWCTSVCLSTLAFPFIVKRTFEDWFFPVLEQGLYDLFCGIYRAKFTFPMHFNGKKTSLIYRPFYDNVLLNMPHGYAY